MVATDHDPQRGEVMNDEPEGASPIFAALVMAGLLALVLVIARDNCWIQTPELPRLVPSLGSPTPIGEEPIE